MNNFDLRKFLAENKLTGNTKLLREESFDGQEGSFLGKVDYWNIYSLEGSSVNDTMMYALVSSEEEEIVSIDVAGEDVSLDQIKQEIEGRGISDEVAQFLLDDINRMQDEGMDETVDGAVPELDPRFRGPHYKYSKLIKRGNHLLSPADIPGEIEILEKALEFLKSLPQSTKE